MKPNPLSALKNLTVPCATTTHFSVRQTDCFDLLAPRTVVASSADPDRLVFARTNSSSWRSIQRSSSRCASPPRRGVDDGGVAVEDEGPAPFGTVRLAEHRCPIAVHV